LLVVVHALIVGLNYMGIPDKLINLAPSRLTRKRVIQMNDDGFSVSLDNSDAAKVYWSTVAEIVAFKHDLFGYDEICLGFRCDNGKKYWWVGEEDIGFKELQAAVEINFNGILDSWWSAVAFPAFEENWTSIWSRAKINEESRLQE
jgi:hypothetical protein